MKDRIILAIDTSCDETSVAVVHGRVVLANVIASQAELHRPYGGVFPTVAKLAHQENLAPALALALKRAHVAAQTVDAVAVTIGPGLAPALEVGLAGAKAFCQKYHKPLIAANHLEGHILSVLAQPKPRAGAAGMSEPAGTQSTLQDQPPHQPTPTPATPSRTFPHPHLTTPAPANTADFTLPVLAIVVSGGNTLFVKVDRLPDTPGGNRARLDRSTRLNSSLPLRSTHHSTTRPDEPTTPHAVTPALSQPGAALTDQPTDVHAAVVDDQQRDVESSPAPSACPLERQPHLQLDTPPADTSWQPQFAYTVLGRTLDDAAGECLDKVGRMLNLGYPAGPVVEAFAKLGNPNRYHFPLPLTQSKTYDLSFSGIKTHSRNLLTELGGIETLAKQDIYDFCAGLQRAVFRHITYKLEKLLIETSEPFAEIWLAGGVAANSALRSAIRTSVRTIARQTHRAQRKASSSAMPSWQHQPAPRLRTPYTKKLCGDNAAMIGICRQLYLATLQ